MRLDKNSFQKQIEKHSLFTKSDALLLAISGGLDSMVLAHLLQNCGYNFQLAHVNFGLRGLESEEDEKFIKEYAEQQLVPFHLKKIDAGTFENSKIGIQETARIIRYQWFEEIAEQIPVSFILLAHHKGDQAETILHKFLRGGMLSALRGMQIKNQNRVRPLLPFSRNEIELYAKENSIKWREDRSNQTTKYTRNYIRHELIPKLQKVNPDIEDSLAKRAKIFNELEELVFEKIKKDIDSNIMCHDDAITIPCNWLGGYSYKHTLLWQLLSKYNFSSAQLEEVLELLNAQSGACVDSSTHRIYRDRDNLLLFQIDQDEYPTFEIAELPLVCTKGISMRIEEISANEVVFGNEQIQFVDLDRIKFPLTVRPWTEGDNIVPLGMKGTQKLSDIFIQNKIPLHKKKRIYAVTDCTSQLIAIPGIKVSELFRITAKTTRVMRVTIQ